MVKEATKYCVELLCDYPQWWRYNIFMMAVGYDRDGNTVSFNNLIDKVYDADYGSGVRTEPAGYPTPRTARLESDPCAYADLYVYVVANTFPLSAAIADSPPFEAVLRISGGGLIEERRCEVNQWGGLTVVAHRVCTEESK